VALLVKGPRNLHHYLLLNFEFLHETRVHHHVSVDFTVPGFPLPTLVTPSKSFVLVPVTLLRKQPLKNFDLRDEDGRALPLLTSEENGEIASAALTYLAEVILHRNAPKQVLDKAVRTELSEIAVGPIRRARTALRNLEKGQGAGSHDQRAILWGNDEMRVLATDFARNFILMTPIEALPGDRRVLKFSYEDTIRPMELSPFVHPLMWAGLDPITYGTRIASLGTARSYHVEIVIPDDLFFVSAQLYAAGSADPVSAEEHSVARAHLYAPGMSRGTSGIVEAHLRVRSTVVLQTLLISSLTSAILATGVFLHWRGIHPSPDALTALVVVLPAIFAAFLARPGEHPVVARLVTGLRVGILFSALLSFAAAGTLAVSFAGKVRLLAWLVLFAFSLLVTAVSAVAYGQAVQAERHG